MPACVVPEADSTDFSLENLPLGVFESPSTAPRVGVALGEHVVDMHALVRDGILETPGAAALGAGTTINAFLALGQAEWHACRRELRSVLTAGSPLDPSRGGVDKYLMAQGEVTMRMAWDVGDYTDFYASYHHARNVGEMFRGPDKALMPNWPWMPIGYHGRASSVVVSPSHVRRPVGQIMEATGAGSSAPVVRPSSQLDYELELGLVVGGPQNDLGTPVPLAEAEQRIFGVVLVNDWSARDVQRWEYVPLGPFVSKSFLTTVSPWVVPMEALDVARAPAPEQTLAGPLPEYLAESNRLRAALDIDLAVALRRAEWPDEHLVCKGNARTLYWSPAQLVAHHTITGCNLKPGDLLATGTISGDTPESRGCLLERTWAGKEPLAMPDGSIRSFLADGDEVVIRGTSPGPAGARIGLGECRGVVCSSGSV